MHLVRLVYFSESRLAGKSPLLGRLQELQRVSAANNAAHGITGALLLDDPWFLQALEGERTAVWSTFRAILDDPRHDDVVLVSCTPITTRLFGDWAMRLVMPTGESARALAVFHHFGVLQPERMSSDDIIGALGALVLSGRSPNSQPSKAKDIDLLPGAAAVAPQA